MRSHAHLTSVSQIGCLLLFVMLSACSTRYPGALPPKPLWLQLDLKQFNPQEREVIYGRGRAVNQLRIDQRRAIAEANAVAELRELLTQEVLRLMKSEASGDQPALSAGDQSAVEALLKSYPWSQAASVEMRFFDAEANTQFAIASLSLQAFEKTLKYDPSDASKKAVVTQYVRLAYQSLRP